MIKEKESPKNWLINDTFYLKITNNEMYNGKYLIFNKVGERTSAGKTPFPVFRAKITNDERLPKTKEELEKYSQKKEEYYRQFCKEDTEKFHLVDGVCEFFDHLKEKDIPFTIASASIKENIDFFIESFGLDRWIKPEDIVYDDGTYENKIAMFHKAADVIGIDMKDIRIYEDSNSGIRNAYDAGCEQIVVICDKENEEEFLKRPGVIEVMQDFSFAKEL